MIDEAQRLITVIRQMEASLDDPKSRREYGSQENDLQVTYPLTRCLQVLKEKHIQIGRLHKERYEQVKSEFSNRGFFFFFFSSFPPLSPL